MSSLHFSWHPSAITWCSLHFNTALNFPPHRHWESSTFTTAAPLNATVLKFHTSFQQEGQIFLQCLLIFLIKIKCSNMKRKKCSLANSIPPLVVFFIRPFVQPTNCKGGRGEKTYIASEIVPTLSWVSKTLSYKVSLNTLKRYVGTSYKKENRLPCVFY